MGGVDAHVSLFDGRRVSCTTAVEVFYLRRYTVSWLECHTPESTGERSCPSRPHRHLGIALIDFGFRIRSPPQGTLENLAKGSATTTRGRLPLIKTRSTRSRRPTMGCLVKKRMDSLSPFKIPHRYCVIPDFHITDHWDEKSNGHAAVELRRARTDPRQELVCC